MTIKVFILAQKQTVNPADKAVKDALHLLGHTDINRVSLGRYLEIEVDDATPKETWVEKIVEICTSSRSNLVNPIMEDYRIELHPPDGEVIHLTKRKAKK